MNIFYLNKDPKIAAIEHNDKHCVKMILEYAQMLSTAHRERDGDESADALKMYKRAHLNHPSTVWTRENEKQYEWLYKLFEALSDEYKCDDSVIAYQRFYTGEKAHFSQWKNRPVPKWYNP